MTDETEKFIELKRQESSLEEEARNGDVEAPFKLGELIVGDLEENLSWTLGFYNSPRDLSEEDFERLVRGVRWYRLAANQQHTKAQAKLAKILLLAGLELFPDGPEEALKWYHLAAQRGHTDAICSLATIFTQGKIATKGAIEDMGSTTLGFECTSSFWLEDDFDRWAKARYWFLKTLDFKIHEPWTELIRDCSFDVAKALKDGIGGPVDKPLAWQAIRRAKDLEKLMDNERRKHFGANEDFPLEEVDEGASADPNYGEDGGFDGFDGWVNYFGENFSDDEIDDWEQDWGNKIDYVDLDEPDKDT